MATRQGGFIIPGHTIAVVVFDSYEYLSVSLPDFVQYPVFSYSNDKGLTFYSCEIILSRAMEVVLISYEYSITLEEALHYYGEPALDIYELYRI